MFRLRRRPEPKPRPTAQRGSVGSAQVWDEARRTGRSEPRGLPPEEPSGLGREQVEGIARAVQALLDARLANCEPAERAALARELEGRLRALLVPPPPAPLRTAPAALAAENPGADLVASTTPLHARPVVGAPTALGNGVAPQLEERLKRLGGILAERADLRERLVELVGSPSAPPAESPLATEDEIRVLDVLQRRFAKLERSLEEARAALAYVAGLEHVDSGLASIYRAVQGLALDDPQREQKEGALVRVFEANLSLQKSDGS